MRIAVLLPKDRTRPGTLRLLDDAGTPMLAMPCLGKSDNAKALENDNPTRDPTKPWGDTPAGTYRPAKVRRFTPEHATLGPYAIPLIGIGGQALEAVKGGRTELYIHATRTNDGGRGEDRLIPTYGCLRIEDDDMRALVEVLGETMAEIEIAQMMERA